jgi:hypothetical protein
MMDLRGEGEDLADRLDEARLVDLPGAHGVGHDGDRVGHPDGVGDLQLDRSARPAATTFLATWRAM